MPKSANPLLRRKSSSPFSTAPRKKAGITRNSQLSSKPYEPERLPDTGLVPSLAGSDIAQDVVSLIHHIQQQTWAEIPERAAGMGSERISEVLRYRKALPPVVSIAHMHALSLSTTETEREIARLTAQGRVRRVVIPGRGKGGAAVGDGLVLVGDWHRRATEETGVSQEATRKYLALMGSNPTSSAMSTASFNNEEVQELVHAGFFTSPAALSSTPGSLFSRPEATSFASISRAGTTAATGTVAAIGGSGAVHESGGGGSTLATKDNRTIILRPKHQMTFSLPAMGAYLKVLTEARLHFLAMLKQLSPRYREATCDMLREKWDGNIPGDATSQAKRTRGEWAGVLPGRTKKWRDFYGLQFEWILAECVGSGLVELFDTGSVGIAVRGT